MRFHASAARFARVIILIPILCAAAAATPPAHAKSPARAAACNTGSATVQQLAAIFNTRDDNFQCLGVKVDGAVITALRVESHRLVARGGATVSDHVEIDEFPVAQIESRQGAVLDGAKGHDAVIVQGRVPPAGGDVELVTSFLYNGLTGEYRSCRVTLDRRADAAWHLVNQYNETVSRIVVRTRNIPVLGTIGIADLEGACTPARS